MAILPDPRGLFIQAWIGPLVTRSWWFAFFIFQVIHYGVVWMTSAASTFPILMMWEFLVRMLVFFTYGAVAGFFQASAVGSPVLIPVHSFKGETAHYGPIVATVSIVWGLQVFMHAVGATQVHNPFPGSLGEAGDWIVFVSFLLLFLTTIVWTYWWPNQFAQVGPYRFSLGFRYRDRPDHTMIPEFILFVLAFPLVPQALWDFLVLPPTSWSNLAAGGLTLAAEAVLYAATYFWGRFRLLDQRFFTPQKSLVSWFEYVIILAATQIGSGLAYLIAAEFLADLSELNVFLIITTLVIIVSALVIGPVLRRRPRAKRFYRVKR